MALTKAEAKSIHNIDKSLALLAQQQKFTSDELSGRVQKIESVVLNGLSHKVHDIYEWMLQQKECQAISDEQVHDVRLLGVKMSLERKNQITQALINGLFILAGIILTAKLTP